MFYSTVQSECARKITVATFLSFFFLVFCFFLYQMESIGASRKKMKMPSLPNDSCSGPLESEDGKDVFQGQGYRLTDLERFSLMFSEGHVCKEGVNLLGSV